MGFYLYLNMLFVNKRILRSQINRYVYNKIRPPIVPSRSEIYFDRNENNIEQSLYIINRSDELHSLIGILIFVDELDISLEKVELEIIRDQNKTSGKAATKENLPILGDIRKMNSYLELDKSRRKVVYARIDKLAAGDTKQVVVRYKSVNKYYNKKYTKPLKLPIKIWTYDNNEPSQISRINPNQIGKIPDEIQVKMSITYPESVRVISYAKIFRPPMNFQLNNVSITVVIDIDNKIWFEADNLFKFYELFGLERILERVPKAEINTVIATLDNGRSEQKKIISEEGLTTVIPMLDEFKVQLYKKWLSEFVYPVIYK